MEKNQGHVGGVMMNSALLKNQGYVSGVMMNSTLLKKAKTFMICIFLKAQKIFLTVQEPFVLYSGRSTDYRAALTGNIPPSSLRSTVVEYSQQITRLKYSTQFHMISVKIPYSQCPSWCRGFSCLNIFTVFFNKIQTKERSTCHSQGNKQQLKHCPALSYCRECCTAQLGNVLSTICR